MERKVQIRCIEGLEPFSIGNDDGMGGYEVCRNVKDF